MNLEDNEELGALRTLYPAEARGLGRAGELGVRFGALGAVAGQGLGSQ